MRESVLDMELDPHFAGDILFLTHHRNFRGLCSYVALARTQEQVWGFIPTKDELSLVLFLVGWQIVVGLMLLVASFRKKLTIFAVTLSSWNNYCEHWVFFFVVICIFFFSSAQRGHSAYEFKVLVWHLYQALLSPTKGKAQGLHLEAFPLKWGSNTSVHI